MIRYISLFSLVFLLVVTSCRREEDITTSTTTTFPPAVELVTTDIAGLVTIGDNTPAAEIPVSVQAEGQLVTTTTNEFGYFSFDDVRVPKDGALVKAETPGYFPGLRRVTIASDAAAHTSIQLKPMDIKNFSTTEGTVTASYDNGVTLTIPVGSLVDENNVAYNGAVQIANAHYSPTDADFGEELPGGLDALNADGEAQVLGTYGMIGVEMMSNGNEALQIADGATATIEMPIPADLLAEAPASIPLWHLDEATGLWIEEGSAEKQGDRYVGTVSHFSFWNCDIPFPYVNITGQAEYANGEAAGQVHVQIARESLETRSGFTDESGAFAGKVPANEDLIISFYNSCHEVVLTQSLGSLSADTDLGTFTLPIDGTTTVFGNLLDCNSEGVANGIVYINVDGNLAYTYTNADGSFSKEVFDCGGTSAEVRGVDTDQQLVSETVTVPVVNLEADAGDLLACDEVPFFLEYSLNGDDAVFFDVATASISQDSVVGGGIEDILYIGASLPNQGGYFNLSFAGFAQGDYPVTSISYYNASLGTSGWWHVMGNQAGDIQVNITTYEDFPGGKIVGTFSGTYDQPAATGVVTNTISGSFRAEKE